MATADTDSTAAVVAVVEMMMVGIWSQSPTLLLLFCNFADDYCRFVVFAFVVAELDLRLSRLAACHWNKLLNCSSDLCCKFVLDSLMVMAVHCRYC